MIRTFTRDACLGHPAPLGYPERPQRLSGILGHLRALGWPVEDPGADRVRARQAVEAVHDPGYVERFERASERGDGLLDSADNPLSQGTWGAAWGAVEATLAAGDAMAAGEVPIFAAVRPPGHHAERATAMGFCFFNNVAVAAEHLRRQHGLSRVAIFDFDVHHGNGTQHLFEKRADVFYASTHQYPFYPGTGGRHERGVGAGEGFTLNLPLPAHTGDEGYAEVIAGQVIPALRRFKPEALLLSAGFDAWARDPLGGMEVTEAGFHEWGLRMRDLAEEVCGGRVLALLEGGYDEPSLPRLVEEHLRGLAGVGRPAAAGQGTESS